MRPWRSIDAAARIRRVSHQTTTPFCRLKEVKRDYNLLSRQQSQPSLCTTTNATTSGGRPYFASSISVSLKPCFSPPPTPCSVPRFVQVARFVSQTTPAAAAAAAASSPFDPNRKKSETAARPKTRKKKKRAFVPRKAAVQLTPRAREFFQLLLQNPPRPEIIGIRLNYEQSSTGEPRMVFSFQFVAMADVGPDDEPVSLEVIMVMEKQQHQDQEEPQQLKAVPKPPAQSWTDGLPKLYVSGNAFLKVLGATVDVNTETLTPILYDKEGNRMDPNA